MEEDIEIDAWPDQEINDRGIQIDLQMVENVIALDDEGLSEALPVRYGGVWYLRP